MLARLSLRLRVFLFFCLLAAGAAALAAAALALGWSRGDPGQGAAPFLTAFTVFVFLNTGFALAIWLLFDENLAKPIEKLSVDLRLRAHSGVDAPVDAESARYLGDLGPAAGALGQALAASGGSGDGARETEQLRAERARLTALLTEIPIATILLNPAGEIVLYDAQAADILSRTAPPRLKAALGDYFELTELSACMARLGGGDAVASCRLREISGQAVFEARLKALGGEGHILLIDPPADRAAVIEPRPLTFDFDLMASPASRGIADSALRDLCFVAFDTETTGLSVERDAIIQIGAVRILNGRMVPGEILDSFVDPGRPIPPASSRIHGISQSDVAGAPDILIASRSLHHFARGAVLVAHNAPFDIGLLRRVAPQAGLEWDHPVLDTVLLSAVIFGTTADHSLDALCARLGVEIPAQQRHRAIGDATATAQALVRMLPLLEGRGIATFARLVAETRRHGRLLQDLNAAPPQPGA